MATAPAGVCHGGGELGDFLLGPPSSSLTRSKTWKLDSPLVPTAEEGSVAKRGCTVASLRCQPPCNPRCQSLVVTGQSTGMRVAKRGSGRARALGIAVVPCSWLDGSWDWQHDSASLDG